MSSIKLKFPAAPAPSDGSDVILALGRLVVAWSSSEFYFGLVASRLLAMISPEEIELARIEKRDPVAASDVSTVFTVLFAIDSTRARRRVCAEIAANKYDEGVISSEWHDRITQLLRAHDRLSRARNKFVHTAMARDEDGNYVFLTKEMMFGDSKLSKKMRAVRMRRNNHLVQARAIDEITDAVAKWIDDAQKLIRALETAAALPSSSLAE